MSTVNVCFPPDGETPYVVVGGKHIGKVRRMELGRTTPDLGSCSVKTIEVYHEQRKPGVGDVEADIPSDLKLLIKLVKD